MKITFANSQDIAERIGNILNRPVNIMDETGKIVASTDTTRIGDIHNGAKELIEKNAHEIDIYPGDAPAGSKNGINVPINIGDRTIGVIGVTGNPDELRDVSIVIGKMAEIFYLKTEESLKSENFDRQRRLFCDDLLLSHISYKDKKKINKLNKRANDLNLSLESIHSIAVFTISNYVLEEEKLAIDDRLVLMLRGRLGDSVYIHHHYIGQKLIVFFNFKEDTSALPSIEDAIHKLSEQTGVIIYCGLSFGINSCPDIFHAHKNAERAMLIASQSPESKLLIYQKMVLEMILSQIPIDSVHEYLIDIFKTKDSSTINSMTRFLNTYFEENGSINIISKKMFIHKNTVQYKIQKVIKQTGYDPRKIEDGLKLLLACKLVKMNSIE